MAEAVPFTIGAHVSCTDGICGQVIRVVVDPIARTVTHLVVEPPHRSGLGRLVPVDLVDTDPASPDPAGRTGEDLRLRCTMTEFEKLESAEQTQFVPGTPGYAAYGPEQVVAWPYFGLGGAGVRGNTLIGTSQTVTYDTIPLDEVEVRRGAHVHATDGSIGQVQGLVIEPTSHHVTHVLLLEGHLWGRKEVAIPISAVSEVEDDDILLNITKRDVEQLPAVDIEHPGG
jgi:sporulation protein YlmC with PRC-barrel domain